MKNSRGPIQFTILLAAIFTLSATAIFGDVKIKSRQTMSGQSSENTTYIKGKRQRMEMAGGTTVMITQCDLRRDIQIMPQPKTYLINLYDEGGNTATPSVTNAAGAPVTKGGVVTTTVTNKDTGERKQMFGYTARHIITTMITESSPDACSNQKSKMEIDGWYIDAAFGIDCDEARAAGYMRRSEKTGCQDKHNMKSVGAAKTGYPVLVKTTMYDENDKPSFTSTSEVIELSKATLDPALFDIPEGYREVKSSTELYSSMTAQSSSGKMSSMPGAGGMDDDDSPRNSNSGMNSNVKAMANSTQSVSAKVGEKKAGVVRLGLAAVKTGAIGEGMNAHELAAAIQNTLSEYLKTPNVEIVQLEAKLPSAIDAEAKQKECDFVIYANIAHKKGGGGGMFGKMLGNVAGSAISHIGYGSTAGAIASQSASHAVYTASSMAANVKSKDELTLDIKLNASNGAQALTRQFKSKAKSNGEDIISPLIEQAAQAIIDAAGKK
jgi:hypothetical protein